MGRSRNDFEEVVTDICNISLRATSCAHKRHRFRPDKPRFVDWYLVLGVDESAGVDVIKKRYRRLALQLHPDKNKHPNTELAFKLVSEAYVCLADKSSRAAFDLQRQSSFCKECCRNPYLQKPSSLAPPPPPSSGNVLQILKGLKSRMLDEARVIENCMKINNANEAREYPIFNPSDYVFHGYPHCRNQRRVHSVINKYEYPVSHHTYNTKAKKLIN